MLSGLHIVIHTHARERDQIQGVDKPLARPGRKQATATEGFEFHISYL